MASSPTNSPPVQNSTVISKRLPFQRNGTEKIPRKSFPFTERDSNFPMQVKKRFTKKFSTGEQSFQRQFLQRSIISPCGLVSMRGRKIVVSK
jgi:hypothetical protein